MGHDTELLWRELRDRLRAFIVRRVGNPADAEDLLQEVFLRIHQHLSTVRDTGRLMPWIFQLTRNAITDYYRAAPRRHEIPGDFLRDGKLGKEENAAAPVLHGDGQTTLNDELAPCLTPLIEQLPEHYREALQLVEIEGLRQRELSERLTVSLSGAKSRVQRGREKLKELLLHCCQVELDKRGNVMDYRPETGRCESTESETLPSMTKTNSGACSCARQKGERRERPTV